MDIKAFDAASAYGAALGRSGTAGVENGDRIGAGATQTAFGTMVDSLVGQTGEAVAAAEKTSIAAVAGNADLVDVVTAVSNAEMVLESVTAVRDRVISAYQEIMRMPI